MAIYEVDGDKLRGLVPTSFAKAHILERQHLQKLLRQQVDVISPDTLIVAEEFGNWEDSKRRIDLLGIDCDANLVVIELKRTEDGGHMELQAIRYAAMVSTLTFDKTVEIFEQYLGRSGSDEATNARAKLLEHLDWDEPEEEQFAQDVRIVLASEDFSKEITTAVLWLNERELDIRCVRIKPYQDNERVLLDVQQVIPLPESADYQVQLKEKKRSEEKSKSGADFTKYDLTLGDLQFKSLWKRGAIFKVVHHLCSTGVQPDRIREVLGKSQQRLWHWLPGKLTSQEFIKQAELAKDGRIFKPKKWFCEEGELIHAGDKSYAFTNQWGKSWPGCMEALKEAFPEAGITFHPTAPSPGEE